MKQTITMQRIETITLKVEVLQKLAPKAQRAWANNGGIGGISSPTPGELQAHVISDWEPAAQGAGRKKR